MVVYVGHHGVEYMGDSLIGISLGLRTLQSAQAPVTVDSSIPRALGECSFFFQAEDGIRDLTVTGVQTCALPISPPSRDNRQSPVWSKGSGSPPFWLATACSIVDLAV